MLGFPPQSRVELKRAVDKCIGLSPEGDCSTGPHGPIGDWDVSRVTDMNAMFHTLTSFNQRLSTWDVSRVIDMCGMFMGAMSFNQDLSKWDVSRVIDMPWMFAYADSFQQVLCGEAWVNSNASKINIFENSPGFISKTVCGVCIGIFVCLFLLWFYFLPPTQPHTYIKPLIRACTHPRALSPPTETRKLPTRSPS